MHCPIVYTETKKQQQQTIALEIVSFVISVVVSLDIYFYKY